MDKNRNMNVDDLANMLCASINAKMEISMVHDKITISGGTALAVTDMYMIVRALECVGRNMLPMIESSDALKECLKHLVDVMDFEDELHR